MADSEITVKVTADAAAAKQDLRDVADTTQELQDKTVSHATASTGAMLQLSGSVLTLKNGLTSLASGRGGVGSLLQVAGAGRAAGGALKALGGTGAAAAAATAAGFALAAAAVVGVGAEVGKASMGTAAWRTKSNDAIEGVVGLWGKATTAVKEYFAATGVGQFFAERSERKKNAELEDARQQIEDAERINNLKGDGLKAEIEAAKQAGDVTKYAQLYARYRKEAADAAEREKREQIETANWLQKYSPEQAAATKEGKRIEREEKAFNIAREIAEGQELNQSQQQRLDRFQKLIGPAIGKSVKSLAADADPWDTTGKRIGADAGAQRQLDQQLVGLAKAGVPMEKLVSTLESGGMKNDDIVKTLDNLKTQLPDGFADKLLKHIKPGVITWE